jgi:hypothetical protein
MRPDGQCDLVRACATKPDPSLVTGVSARPAGACRSARVLEQNGDASMPKPIRVVVGGVDTHSRAHHAHREVEVALVGAQLVGQVRKGQDRRGQDQPLVVEPAQLRRDRVELLLGADLDDAVVAQASQQPAGQVG